MPIRKSTSAKFSLQQNVDFGMRVFAVLAETKTSMNISQIQKEDFMLMNLSQQKMTRVLSELIEMGIVIKEKDKFSGRMTYKLRDSENNSISEEDNEE